MTRRLCGLLLATLLAAGCESGGSPAAPEPVAPAHDPVLFVHGWSASPASWGAMMVRFRQEGWSDRELHTVSYGSGQTNAEVAELIRSRVTDILSQTGATKVDVIAHSMGSLSSRHFVKFLGGAARVEAWVSLAGPNHGTRIATLCSASPCFEMRPGSTFLESLNAGDETPDATRYATWWSPCDEAIDPRQSVILAGADNNETACLSHSALLTDPTVFQQVRRFIAP